MTLKELKSCIDQAYKKAGAKYAAKSEIEVWLADKLYRLTDVGQFDVVPDVMLTIKKAK